ncbi:MAG: tryptophan--tRNA ligase, partial [Patescibacteria group bacterium]
KFNNAFGETFKEPKEKILQSIATVPGIDGKKMSKSYGNTIPLFGNRDEISRLVMGIVTDSKAESPENVYAIHSLLKSKFELSELYKTNKGKYKVLKEALIEDLESLIAPMRALRDSISDEDAKRIIKEGGEKARERASKKMADVRKKIGVSL